MKKIIIIKYGELSTKKDNKNYFVTKGIANQIEDPEIEASSIYGKVIYKTVILSFISHLMQNVIIYYLIFMSVGVAFSYEFLRAFVLKEKEE